MAPVKSRVPGPPVFLGWTGSPLERARDWLLAERGTDLAGTWIALPGARAARALEELLARRAGSAWNPPRIVTQGALTDELVRLDRPVAGRLARTLAWEAALGELPAASRERIAPRLPPGVGGAALLAETLRTLHGRLSPGGLDFRAVLERLGAQAPPHPGAQAPPRELHRWEALADVEAAWRRILARLGFADPHEARRAAIEAGRIDGTARVVLVGVADLHPLVRRLVQRLGERATALVFAPAELAEGFDAEGGLVAAFWRARPLDLPLERWHVADKPADQAERAMEIVASWSGRFAAEDVAIGVADPEVAPYLERRLRSLGACAQRSAGAAAARSAPARLLSEASAFVSGAEFPAYAALVRHPDLERVLRERLQRAREEWAREDGDPADLDPCALVDAYQEEHLPRRVTGRWAGRPDEWKRMRALHRAVLEILGDLAQPGERPLSAWPEAVRAFLERVYGARELDPAAEGDRALAEALELVAGVLGEIEELPGDLASAPASASDALERIVRALSWESLAPPFAGDGAIELLGWLELPLDGARALVVTGFDEGRVPAPAGGDAFLSDSLSRALGLAGRDERTARDAYALALLAHSRAELALVSGRRTGVGDPLLPSRLLFQGSDEEAVERVGRWIARRESQRPALVGAGAAIELPRRSPIAPLQAIPISAFKDFLKSPYEFYLRRVLGLETIEGVAREMDPRGYGNLVHEVLCDFGRGPVAGSADERAIRAFLDERLAERALRAFGDDPLPAVAIQLERLRHRLKRFAEVQAERASEGWRIVESEWRPDRGGVPFPVDGVAIDLRGRIDRIDHHPGSGCYEILDYKTGDRGDALDKARRRDGTWVDPQLPLYRVLAEPLALDGPVALGYVALGKDVGAIGFQHATWDEAAVESGIEVARDVVRAVRAGEFFDLDRPPENGWILGAIAGVGLLADAEEGE